MVENSSQQDPDIPRHWARALLAMALTAWAAITLGLTMPGFVQAQIDPSYTDPYATSRLINQVVLLASFGIPISIAVCVAVGVPTLFLAYYFKLTSWWHASLAGAIAGAAIGFGLALSNGSTFAPYLLQTVLEFTVVGIVTGLAGWRVLKVKDKTA